MIIKRKLFNAIAAAAKLGGGALNVAGLGGGKFMGAMNIGTTVMGAVSGKQERAANEEAMSSQIREQQNITKQLQNIANS